MLICGLDENGGISILCRTARWCNGNTPDSGSGIQGSNPCRAIASESIKQAKNAAASIAHHDVSLFDRNSLAEHPVNQVRGFLLHAGQHVRISIRRQRNV